MAVCWYVWMHVFACILYMYLYTCMCGTDNGATPTPPVSINQGSGWLFVISASVIFAASLLYMHVHV